MKKKILLSLSALLILFFGVILFIPARISVTQTEPVACNRNVLKRVLTGQEYFNDMMKEKNLTVNTGGNIMFHYKEKRWVFTALTENIISTATITEKDTIQGLLHLLKTDDGYSAASWTCEQETNHFFNRLNNYLQCRKLHSSMKELLLLFKKNAVSEQFVYKEDIRIEILTDSIVITTAAETSANDLYRQMQKSFDRLNSYLIKNRLNTTGNYMAHINKTKDSFTVMTGIPASGFAAPESNISYMQMPVGGKMITAVYTGIYKERSRAYAAMEKYISDYELKIVSVPYEKFSDNKLPVSDESFVKLKLYYPVF